jgi:signal transduction histidine kinase
MRFSIRHQVLVPIVAIQAVTLAAITVASVAMAARRTERQIIDRLEGVTLALGRSNFPLSEGVLARMHELSGARFVVYDPHGDALAASDPPLLQQAPVLDQIPATGNERFGSLSDAPRVTVSGQPHLAVLIGLHSPAPGSSLLVLYPESSWLEARWESAQAPLILGGVALALMAAATTWTAHRIKGRVHRLDHQVARIAEGDFRELEPGGYDDEVQDLERSINLMCAQLRQMRQTISQTERTHLLAQLAAGLAHQMRNALTGARMSLQLHLKRCDAARNDPSVSVALRQLALTEEQVRGLLALGRIEERPHVPGDLVRLISDVASLLEPTAQHGRVELDASCRVPAGVATVLMDEPGLRAAVLNLGLNALEAAGPGGSVRLDLCRQDGDWVIEVSDTGSGPPTSLQETLFDPFVTGKPEGVGLGLALARHVALAHHGSLSWKHDGGWTRFRLSVGERPVTLCPDFSPDRLNT